jgi:hypothetical protein
VLCLLKSLQKQAPRKRARKEQSASSTAAEIHSRVDETHAVYLARHFADLHKRRSFTDLHVAASVSIRPNRCEIASDIVSDSLSHLTPLT